jgi:AcrB/AcrD/AcrF family
LRECGPARACGTDATIATLSANQPGRTHFHHRPRLREISCIVFAPYIIFILYSDFADYYLTDDNAVVVPRLNSIMMTSAAAMRGALPFAIGLEDGELRRRLGIAILSGLIVSQMLTLCTPR